MSRQPGSARKRRRLRRAYAEQRGRCCWCGEPMLPLDAPGRHNHPLQATLEHYDSRLDPERGARAGEIRTGAAHRKCNNARGRAEYMELPLEERRRRAKGRDEQRAGQD